MEVTHRLKSCKQRLENLGPSRETREQRFKLLLDLATEFQTLANYALDSKYGAAKLFKTDPKLRLATLVINRDEKFDQDVRAYGYKMSFDNNEGDHAKAEKPDGEGHPSHEPLPVQIVSKVSSFVRRF